MVKVDLEINPEATQMIDQMTEQEIVEVILNRNPTNIVNILITTGIHGNTAGRCTSM